MNDEALLWQPSEEAATKYYAQVVQRLGCPAEVRLDAGGGRGKGVFAARAIPAGAEIWRERPLAGVQTLDSSSATAACSVCLRAIGTLEEHVGGALCAIINELADPESDLDPDEAQARADKIHCAVDGAKLQGLMEGTVKLPYRELVDLPAKVACRGGCGEHFCSAECEAGAWEAHHCWLCPGPDWLGGHTHSAGGRSGGGGAGGSGSGAGGSGSGSGSKRGAVAPQALPQEHPALPGVKVNRAKLAAFLRHANDNSEHLKLAAQVLVMTWVAAARLLAASTPAPDAPPQPASGAAAATASDADGGCPQGCGGVGRSEHAAALRQAFLPFALGHKAPWWEVVSVEDEEDPEEHRALIQNMVAESLALLTAALAPSCPALRATLTLEAYGSVIGMFELNNLGITVPSPADQYFTAVLADPPASDVGGAASGGMGGADSRSGLVDQQVVEVEVKPLFEALDGEDCPVQGTAFVALHSCINHSCAPNARVKGNAAGEALVHAARDIRPGEEITTSYIDEDELDLQERRAALTGYGFQCACERCVAEALAAELAGRAAV